MNERRVRAAVDHLVSEARGFYLGAGVPSRLVPVSAIDALVDAIAAPGADEPDEPDDVPTDRPTPVT